MKTAPAKSNLLNSQQFSKEDFTSLFVFNGDNGYALSEKEIFINEAFLSNFYDQKTVNKNIGSSKLKLLTIKKQKDNEIKIIPSPNKGLYICAMQLDNQKWKTLESSQVVQLKEHNRVGFKFNDLAFFVTKSDNLLIDYFENSNKKSKQKLMINQSMPIQKKKKIHLEGNLKKNTKPVDKLLEPQEYNEYLNNCCICRETFKQQTIKGKLACGHSFCFNCIKNWSDVATTCPLCKYTFLYIEQIKNGVTQKQVPVIKKKFYVESSSDEDIEVDDTPCYKCGKKNNEFVLLLCDACHKKVCHTYCCGLDKIPDEDWICHYCQKNKKCSKITKTNNTNNTKPVIKMYLGKRNAENKKKNY